MPMPFDIMCLYAMLQQVEIDEVTPDKISFFTRSSLETRERFTVQAKDVWAVPPAQTPKAVKLQKGAVGNLYMTRAGWAAKAANGATIYEAGNDEVVLFKWPQCKPYRTIEDLDVVPSSIVVTGAAKNGQQKIKMDLLKDEFVAPHQSLVWNGAQEILIALSDTGVKKYETDTLAVWPTSIKVTGKPAAPAIEGTVDILDAEYSDFIQTLAWKQVNAPVTLRLAVGGFNAFDAPPNALRYVALGYTTAYPMEIVQEWISLRGRLNPHGEIKRVLEMAKLRVGLTLP
jgi:hypothetical protein